MGEMYDCIIIGGGPAGLAAALYSARDNFKTLVLEKFYPGGQILTTDRIENYPGYMKIGGSELVEKMVEQSKQFGAGFKMSSEVERLEKLEDGNIKVVCGKDEFVGRAVILSPGSAYRKLGVPGEEEFRQAGAGVSYCGTCDGAFFKGKKVVAVGGGNVAVEDTLHLTKFASKVTMIHRRDQFRAQRVLVDELMKKVDESGSNLELELDTVVKEIRGEGQVESVLIENVKSGEQSEIECDGVFIFVGMVPNTDFVKGFVEMTDNGFIKSDPAYMRSSVRGVFVAGDCRVGAAMQLATAAADGVVAAIMMKQYFRDADWWDEPVSDSLQPGGW